MGLRRLTTARADAVSLTRWQEQQREEEAAEAPSVRQQLRDKAALAKLRRPKLNQKALRNKLRQQRFIVRKTGEPPEIARLVAQAVTALSKPKRTQRR